MILFFLLLPLFAVVNGQFGNLFDQIFHHDRPEQTQAREPRPAEQYQWSMQQTECSGYLCPTFDCVNHPRECPCPFTEDSRCDVGDEQFICVRGGCEGVERALKLGSTK